MARPRTTSDEAILAATARVIDRNGLARLTVAAAAREAGLAPATLIQRFGSKRGLLLALSTAAVGQVADDFAAAVATATTTAADDVAGRSPLTSLLRALTGMAHRVGDRNALAHSLAFMQMDIADPEFRALAAAHSTAVRDGIRRLLCEAVDIGELAADLDVDRLARSVQVTYNGSLIVWALTGDENLNASLIGDLTDLLGPYLLRPFEIQ